jgi:uncharacterized surface protein with fasciclin (FAS1) repeats
MSQFLSPRLEINSGEFLMPKRLILTILLIAFAGLGACTSAEPDSSSDVLAPLPTIDASLPSLLDLVSEDPNLVFFMNGLASIGLTDELLSGGPFTIFAPSNVAFSEAGVLVSQMDPALLGNILDNHLVDGTFSETDLVEIGSVVTLSGEPLAITQNDTGLQIAYAPLMVAARQANNGMLYVIDSLLLPPETGPEKSMLGVLQADGRFTTFLAAIEGTDLMGLLRFGHSVDAVLAPTDKAFANLPTNVVALLEDDPIAMEFVVNFHLLKPDGWPQGKDLTLADMVEIGEISTSLPIDGSGFGRGFEKIVVTETDGNVQIGGANVETGDMDATNGIVHAIDSVLIPQVILEPIE